MGIKVGDHWKSKSPSVTFGEGAIVSGNSGRGVCIDTARFLMIGGEISYNEVNHGGGGIYNAGTLTMTGGSVTNCTASKTPMVERLQ